MIAISLVLIGVFLPTAFITGLQGTFFKQFAITIAASTAISLIVSLTLSPAMAALLLKPHAHRRQRQPVRSQAYLGAPLRWFFRGFNWAFGALSHGYAWLTRKLIRIGAVLLVIYAGLLYVTYDRLMATPTGLIPQLDRAYFIAAFQLPPGSTSTRTDAVVRRASEIMLTRPGVDACRRVRRLRRRNLHQRAKYGRHLRRLAPFEERIASRADEGRAFSATSASRWASSRTPLSSFSSRPPFQASAPAAASRATFRTRPAAGCRRSRTRPGRWPARPARCRASPRHSRSSTCARPKIYADIDRTKAEQLGVPISRVFETLSVYMGSAFVNDFNILGPHVPRDGAGRQPVPPVAARCLQPEDAEQRRRHGADRLCRDLQGHDRRLPRAALQSLSCRRSPGSACSAATRQAPPSRRWRRSPTTVLPQGFGFEWTEIALQEKLAGNTAILAFGLSVVFVFLLLSALYESWLLPLAVILIVPMCILAAMIGVNIRGLDRNILVEIGLIVLVGLAAKNAILIVEFAKAGRGSADCRATDAAVEAARTRLRPILMTSLAFILGVVPLVFAEGAGAEMRQSLGTAVFSGMLGVTLFGLIFTPVFYVLVRTLAPRAQPHEDAHPTPPAEAPTG